MGISYRFRETHNYTKIELSVRSIPLKLLINHYRQYLLYDYLFVQGTKHDTEEHELKRYIRLPFTNIAPLVFQLIMAPIN